MTPVLGSGLFNCMIVYVVIPAYNSTPWPENQDFTSLAGSIM
jgi:hypothetical protein